jgi:hypothetical protein
LKYHPAGLNLAQVVDASRKIGGTEGERDNEFEEGRQYYEKHMKNLKEIKKALKKQTEAMKGAFECNNNTIFFNFPCPLKC